MIARLKRAIAALGDAITRLLPRYGRVVWSSCPGICGAGRTRLVH